MQYYLVLLNVKDRRILLIANGYTMHRKCECFDARFEVYQHLNTYVFLSGIIIDNCIQFIFHRHMTASDKNKRMVLRGYRIVFSFITICRCGSMTCITNTINTDIRHVDVHSCLYMLLTSQTVFRGLPPQTMMTSSNGNMFRVTGFDVFFDLRLNKRLSKQWWGWWFETPSRSLWRHHNDYFGMMYPCPDLRQNLSVKRWYFPVFPVIFRNLGFDFTPIGVCFIAVWSKTMRSFFCSCGHDSRWYSSATQLKYTDILSQLLYFAGCYTTKNYRNIITGKLLHKSEMPQNVCMKLRLLKRWFHNVKAHDATSMELLKNLFSSCNLSTETKYRKASFSCSINLIKYTIGIASVMTQVCWNVAIYPWRSQ